MNNNCPVNDPSEICDVFNAHFAAAGNQFDTLYSSSGFVFNSQPPSHLSSNHTSLFTLQPFTCSTVIDALQSIDCRKSTGEDIDPYFLKPCAPIIGNHITYLFNLSVTSGVIPQVWKSAHVVPLHKGGDKSNLNNFWPISKLSCLAKVLESLVNNSSSHSYHKILYYVLPSLVSELNTAPSLQSHHLQMTLCMLWTKGNIVLLFM